MNHCQYCGQTIKARYGAHYVYWVDTYNRFQCGKSPTGEHYPA